MNNTQANYVDMLVEQAEINDKKINSVGVVSDIVVFMWILHLYDEYRLDMENPDIKNFINPN